MAAGGSLLIVGALGFVGRHLAELAELEGVDVVTADRVPGADHVCDLLDPASVGACVAAAGPTMVVNMAGAASVAASWEDPAGSFEANALGALHLLEAVRAEAPESHVLCVSSAEVYGEPGPDSLPLTEDSPLAPVNPYGAGKAAMEALCGQYSRGSGLRVGIVRAFNQIGPGQSPSFAAPSFARQIAAAEVSGAERAELLVGNLEAARDFTDVRDTARAFLEVARNGLTGPYNLCSGRALTLAELVDEMVAAATIPVEVRRDPARYRPADPSIAYGSADRLREAVGWAPRIPVSQTVADLLEHSRRQVEAER